MTKKKVLTDIVAVAPLAVATVASVAQHASARRAGNTYEWTGDSPIKPHEWGEQKNWKPEGKPEDGDVVRIEKPATILNVPSISLLALTVNSATLVGPTSTISTHALVWPMGTIEAGVVVKDSASIRAAEVGGPVLDNGATTLGDPPVSFANHGTLVQTGGSGHPGEAAGRVLARNHVPFRTAEGRKEERERSN